MSVTLDSVGKNDLHRVTTLRRGRFATCQLSFPLIGEQLPLGDIALSLLCVRLRDDFTGDRLLIVLLHCQTPH